MKKDIQQLLQECLEGYDAGLTPDECLSAYPNVRAELEPLFRQAISLRVAYAASPREEFRYRAREKLLFAAGRELVQALSAEPDPTFVSATRRRLLNRAGAEAQEALRDVPPPRLPFWVNARRHLLEAAASAPPRPVHRVPVGLRSAISAAVVVVAVGVAGAGFLLQDSPANRTERSALSSELDYISEQVRTYEQLRANGQVVSPSLLDDLAARTNRLAEQYSAASPNSELIQQLPDLIDRQQTLLNGADSEMLAAAEERLEEADEQVETTDDETPEPIATETPDISVAIAPTSEPSREPTVKPTATEEITVPTVEIVDADELGPRQLVLQYDADETALGIRWWRVTTSTLTFVIPESWEILELDTDEDGLAVLPADAIFIKTDVDDMILIISTEDGEVNTVVDGEQFTLRTEGADGEVLSTESLADITGLAENWASLYNMLASIELSDDASTPTPTSTSTPTATPTQDPDDEDGGDASDENDDAP